MRIQRLAVVLAAGVLAAGCSGSPAEELSQAVARTLGQGTAHSRIVSTTTLPEGGGRFTITAQTDYDFEHQRGRGTFDLSELPGIQAADPEAGRGEVVFEGGVVVMRLPLLQGWLPPGTEWLRVDAGDAGETAGLELPQLSRDGTTSPGTFLHHLEGAVEVREEGRDEVEGVEATRYSLVIDFERARRKAPAQLRGFYDSIVEDLGVRRSPGSVWIDDEGLIRRIDQRWRVRLPAGGGTMLQDTTVTFGRFGEPVRVEMPPEGRILDLGEVLGRD